MGSSHYCVWGSCTSWESCCGNNVCCNDVDFNSLYLTAAIFGTIIVMALCCACFYCSSRRVYSPLLKKYLKISYTLLSTQQENRTGPSTNQDATMEDCIVQIEKTKTVL
ncbi:PREDICTED: uncharacterized protein LOC108579685 [Habropoda laboriosa]|uniref:uncharacterized protein LOC108579685 n=1 Tax=Habropoda laboriosa TaxID=597456 RepID=UPI00083D6794|nr:PREDICTED: uncharacterized protein LOC108579685 [Habropoda laboriosa]